MNDIIPFNDLQQMGVALAKSGLFGMKTPEQAIALMLVAQAEGQHPATIAQDYDIIQGKATRKTHSVLARFQAAGGKVEWHTLTGMVADATFSHPQGGALRMEWTIAQAKLAGLTGKDNWKNYPRAMLRARCIAEGVRAVYPAAIGGMLVAEEAQDMTPSVRHMGEADVAASDPQSWIAKAVATTTDEDAATVWADGGKALASAKDREGYAALKAAVIDHRTKLKQAADAERTVDVEATEVDQFVADMEAAESGND
jgi:hypothetical protein